MSPYSRKLLCRTMLDTIWNRADLDRMNAFFAPDAVHHELEAVSGGLGCTNRLLGQFVGLYRCGFPDLRLTVVSQTSDVDLVITRWRAEGTQTGPLLTIEPSGRPMSVEGTRTDRFVGTQIVETWNVWDVDSMLAQIGAIPEPVRPAEEAEIDLLARAAVG